ncbi:MAG TPA: Holliday junction branch migration protein RuvA [Candidatus Cloacimonadota bacterium]|nr:Holliday junction branch migration protein RuvA [Candidatus Cloacimonadota bacterium]HPT71825.1 Holliday junction branch migration protein RuvA [Candidatus Cloacimonadota bacterium]
MYAYLNGTLKEKNPFSCIIECSGVGYDVRIPISTYETLPALEEQVKLLIHYHVSEDDIRLFGFASDPERLLFRQLISISRIGPKIALSILSALSVQNIIQAIVQDDDRILATIPGLGKKSAQRLIIELKDKISEIPQVSLDMIPEQKKDVLLEAETALMSLGYKLPEIRSAFRELKADNLSLEEIIKRTIQYLYRKRNV